MTIEKISELRTLVSQHAQVMRQLNIGELVDIQLALTDLINLQMRHERTVQEYQAQFPTK